jgi:hypothetical protein
LRRPPQNIVKRAVDTCISRNTNILAHNLAKSLRKPVGAQHWRGAFPTSLPLAGSGWAALYAGLVGATLPQASSKYADEVVGKSNRNKQ